MEQTERCEDGKSLHINIMTRTDARGVGWGVGGRLLVRAFEIKANKVTFGGASAIAVYVICM